MLEACRFMSTVLYGGYYKYYIHNDTRLIGWSLTSLVTTNTVYQRRDNDTPYAKSQNDFIAVLDV